MESEQFSLQRERIEAATRLIAGGVVAVLVWVFMPIGPNGSTLSYMLLQYGVLLYVFGGLCIAAEFTLRPAPSVVRNLLSITLDVTAVSAGLYVGAGVVDPIALFYLWIMVGSGLVYGMPYLFVACGLALSSFAFVYLASPYWQARPMFSATIAGLMVLLGPYLATLLASLERTRRLVTWQADHDVLTSLLGRRAFERELSRVVPSKNARAEHFLLYMDLDRFKQINDGAGHAAGDQALMDIATLFAAHAPAPHLLARMGGDEFCLLLIDVSLENARRCAERMRNEVASYRLAWGTSYYTLGVSIGVVSSVSSTDGPALVRLGDAACYAAKNNGRNQVHVVDQMSDDTDTQVIRRLRLPTKNSASPASSRHTA